MTYTLTISSQGQVLIPSDVRKYWKVKAGNKLLLNPQTGSIMPQPQSWYNTVRGIAKGVYGKGEEYIKKERATWDK